MPPAKPLLISMGEPAGVGPELVLKAWLARTTAQIPPFALLGDLDDLARRGTQAGIEVPLRSCTVDAAGDLFDNALPVVPVFLSAPSTPGRPDGANGGAVVEAIETAVELIHTQQARALVTCPIHKAALYQSGFRFPGHTEFLGALAETHWGVKARPVMMLADEDLRVVPVTVHIPLRQVPEALNAALIEETGRIVAGELTARFGLDKPRIAVCGLNPHAGEQGALGSEDEDIIAPAVARLRGHGIDAFGPVSADTLFHERARQTYDAVLAMYHDQALIPIKTIGFDRAVNITLGLPFVRTSPDHGTALDIAGTGTARPDSLIAALQCADRMTQGGTQGP